MHIGNKARLAATTHMGNKAWPAPTIPLKLIDLYYIIIII